MPRATGTVTVIVQTAPDASEANVHVTSFPVAPHTPVAEVTLETVMPGAPGTVSVT